MSGRSGISMHSLQAADRWLGRLAFAALQPWRLMRQILGPRESGDHVLLLKFWGLGSIQLLGPAVAALKRRHPDARLVFVTLQENAEFARALGLFDEVRTLDVRAQPSLAGWVRIGWRIARLVRVLRAERYRAVYDFEFFTRFSAFVAFLCGAPDSHGFSAPGVWRGGFHRRTTPFNRYWHVARNFRALAGGENGRDVAIDEVVGCEPSAEARAALERRLDAAAARGPLVVVNANAGRLSLERRWPAARHAELSRLLADEDEATVVLVGAPSEVAHVAEVRALAGATRRGAVLDWSGRLAFDEFLALLARADLVVSNDSGPMHIAAAMGTPTLGLFGPETPVLYGPLGARAHALWKPVVCSPCINVHNNKQVTCWRGTPECLTGIAVQEVLTEARVLLSGGVLQPALSLPRRGGLRVVSAAGPRQGAPA
jgi:ADP-heptose:LPS heptosyltransferase